MQSRTITFISIFCFCVWIFPMGLFIKPVDEARVCNGQRAICMCAQEVMAKKVEKVMQQGLMKRGVPSQNQKGSNSGPSSQDFLTLAATLESIQKDLYQSQDFSFHYHFLFSRLIEHVPKV